MSKPTKTVWRSTAIGAVAAVALGLSACGSDNSEDQAQRLLITVCNQRSAVRNGAVTIITSADGSEYSFIPLQHDYVMIEQGATYEVTIEPSAGLDRIANLSPVNGAAQSCP